MNYQLILIYFAIGVVIGYFAYRVLAGDKEKTEIIDESAHKEQLILKFIEAKGQIKNNDIQRILDVSDATATRYLQNLENKRKIIQVGGTGRSVFYQKI